MSGERMATVFPDFAPDFCGISLMEASRQVGGDAVFSIQKQISAGLSLRVRSKPVNPAGSDMLLLYFCDGSLAGGNPSQMKETLKSLEYHPPQHSLQSQYLLPGK